MRGSPHSIWVKLQRFPPIVMRLLATKPGARHVLMDDQELVERSENWLTISDIKRLSYLSSWDSVSVLTLEQFSKACDVDLSDPKRMRTLTRYLNSRPKWVHLRRHKRYPEFRQMLSELFK